MKRAITIVTTDSEENGLEAALARFNASPRNAKNQLPDVDSYLARILASAVASERSQYIASMAADMAKEYDEKYEKAQGDVSAEAAIKLNA
jgi:hypothetical protein